MTESQFGKMYRPATDGAKTIWLRFFLWRIPGFVRDQLSPDFAKVALWRAMDLLYPENVLEDMIFGLADAQGSLTRGEYEPIVWTDV